MSPIESDKEIRENQPNLRHPRSKRSEEIVDIVDRMPMTFGRWVALSVVVFSLLLLLFGWIIKYPDSRVIVKLDNYPSLEFGSIEGTVASVSLLAQPQKTEQSVVETYLLLVDLPKGLTTNYGETLDFRHEIGGTADIVVKERRLIQRLFDNLKYRTK